MRLRESLNTIAQDVASAEVNACGAARSVRGSCRRDNVTNLYEHRYQVCPPPKPPALNVLPSSPPELGGRGGHPGDPLGSLPPETPSPWGVELLLLAEIRFAPAVLDMASPSRLA